MSPTEPPEELEDVRAIRACARGDLEGLETLYGRYGVRMKSLARNLMGNEADAEDAVQDAFVKLHQAAAGFRAASKVSTWLYRLLVNTCFDLLRKRRRRAADSLTDLDAASHPAEPGADPALRVSLERSLARIGERPRTAFLLYAVEGLTHREIGEVLEVSETGSRSLLFEARRQLQPLLLAGAVGKGNS